MPTKKSFETQLTHLSLIASIPTFLLLLWVMYYAEISIFLILLTTLIGSVVILFCHVKIHQKSAYQFRSLSNLLDAMVQGDYSLRARSSHGDRALNELVDSINALSKRLNKQRLESTESQLLLKTVINHIDVAILALNSDNQIVLTNPASAKLLQLREPISTDLNLHDFTQFTSLEDLNSGQSYVMPLTFGHQQGRFNIHIEEFRESGKPHKLLFITDVSLLLRNEERSAWQSLVRVISHEINNSLAPIASISQTLQRSLTNQSNHVSTGEGVVEGLGIIAQRANNLTHFVNSYKQIAQLPEAKKENTSVGHLVEKIRPLFQKVNVVLEPSKDVDLFIDPVQFEQVLINLIKNAVESVQSVNAKGKVTISWQVEQGLFKLIIADEGRGISNSNNLFVPFYTTKKQGSGIGLVLSRQILEMHNGQLTLLNREDRQGCLAIIELEC